MTGIRRFSVVLLALLLAAAAAAGFWMQALAQDAGGYDCEVMVGPDGAFDARCVPQATATATGTATAAPTNTATPRPTSTATNTPAPTATNTPTATSTVTATPRPTNTATAISTATSAPLTATPAPAGNRRANVPLIDARRGDELLDSNNWTSIWAGDVSPDGGYSQLRMVGDSDGMQLYAQAFTPLAGGGFGLQINGRDYSGQLRDASGWEWGGTGIGSRGFGAYRMIPWADLGGKPLAGDIWPLTFTAHDGEQWRGAIRWGLPDYAGRTGQYAATVKVVADASLGGGTDCAYDNDPNSGFDGTWFEDWGDEPLGMAGGRLTNLGQIIFGNVQNQWDTTDWPCYARIISRWENPNLPPGAVVTGAWLELYYFGHPYPGPNDVQEFRPHEVIEVYQADDAWDELTVTWDNAPAPTENISRTDVDWCKDGVECWGVRQFDVTEIIRRGGHSALLSTSAGQYHGGRYFYLRETGAAPIVRIAYTLGGIPTWTPTPNSTPPTGLPTASPTATATMTPTPTATASATAVPSVAPTLAIPTAVASPTAQAATASPTPLPPTTAPTSTSTPTPAVGVASCGYYLSPSGNDAAPGTAQTVPWRTFARAWQSLQPGDTLCLLDGVYYESLWPAVRNGQAGKPITVRALNDGKAIIDGQGQRVPVKLGEHWPGPVGDYYVIEGIVARNGTQAAVLIYGSNNVLRRVSAYNADVDDNTVVVWVIGSNNLIEDAVAAGTGRYMFNMIMGSNNTIRRAFAMYGRWDGRKFCGVQWPYGIGFGVYNSSGNLLEDVISYGRTPTAGILVQANGDTATANDNTIAGAMVLLSGRESDGSNTTYGGLEQPTSRPGPTNCDIVTQLEWGGQRTGIFLWGQGNLNRNVFRDVIAAGNAGVGFIASQPFTAGQKGGNVLDRATLLANGEGAIGAERAQGGNIYIAMPGVTVTNSRIPGRQTGEGAQMDYRHIGGQRTAVPLWPWPMQERIRAELGIDVTALARQVLDAAK